VTTNSYTNTAQVVASDLRNFVKSKQDLYIILTIEGQLHLPPFDDCTMEFMRDALSGKKKLIPNKQLCPVTVPRYKEFNSEKLEQMALNDDALRGYLPEPSATKVINRKFLFNVSRYPHQAAGNQHTQGGLVQGADRESAHRSETEASAHAEQVYHDERGHVQADHNKQSRV
jgi:hypothetical protein